MATRERKSAIYFRRSRDIKERRSVRHCSPFFISLSHHDRLTERVGFQFGSGLAVLAHHKRYKPVWLLYFAGSSVIIWQ